MNPVVLDADTLSHVIRGHHPGVLFHASEYLRWHGGFTFSLMTRYETLRGLKLRGAVTQAARFVEISASANVLPLTDEVVVRAADLYADLPRRGELLPDADLFIAATALENGLALVTSNASHCRRIPRLTLDCWTA